MEKTLFIFDMDGLLIDTESIYQKCWKQSFQRENLDVSDAQCRRLVGMDTVFGEIYFEKLFGKRSEYWRLREIREPFFWKSIETNGLPIKKGVLDVLKWCKEKDYHCALATSTYRDRALKLLEIAGLDFSFDYQLFGDEVKNSKPDPEIFLTILKLAEVSKENALVFEDSFNGLMAAKQAGIDAVWVKDVAEIDFTTGIRPILQLDRIDEIIEIMKKIA